MNRNITRYLQLSRLDVVAPAVAIVFGTLAALSNTVSLAAVFETLVVAQASLLAIVISVSLLSMQISTNRYAPLLAHLYRERGFNAIIGRFGGSILLNLAFLVVAGELATPAVGALAVAVGTGVAAWSFVSLLSIERWLMAFLDPEPVLEQLTEQVSLDRYLAFSETGQEDKRVSRNPVLEIVQIARTSLEQNDNYGSLRAVDALETATTKLLRAQADRETEPDSLHKLFDYWNQIGAVAVEQGADDVLHGISLGLGSVTDQALTGGLRDAAVEATRSRGQFCRRAFAAGRLERRDYDRLQTVLARSLDGQLYRVQQTATTAAERLTLAMVRDPNTDVRGDDDPVGSLVAIVCDGWQQLVHDAGSLEEAPVRTTFEHFEATVAALVTANATHHDDRLARALCEHLARVAIAGAERDAQWVVERSVRLLAGASETDARCQSECLAALRRIENRGGRPGVVAALTDDPIETVPPEYRQPPAVGLDDGEAILDQLTSATGDAEGTGR